MTEFYVYPIDHDFEIGDKVIDMTAEFAGWDDLKGEVINVDGSHVQVKYNSGNVRWKMYINLRKDK